MIPCVETETVAANEVRIPEPAQGRAIRVDRHERPKAVILHPSDFELFQRLLAFLGEPEPSELRLTDLELEVHRMGETGRDEPELDHESLTHALGEE